MSERNNTLNILSGRGGATGGCTCCRICNRHSVLGIWFSNLSLVCVFLSLLSICFCSRSAACLFSLLAFSSQTAPVLKLRLWSLLSSARRWALDILDTVSNLYSVPVSSGVDAVVYDDTQTSLLTPIHLTVCSSPSCVPFLCSERFFVKLNKSGLPKSPEKTERQCTLFVVRSEHDFGTYKAWLGASWSWVKLNEVMFCYLKCSSLLTRICSDAEVCFPVLSGFGKQWSTERCLHRRAHHKNRWEIWCCSFHSTEHYMSF